MHFLARRSKRLEKHGITSKDWMKSITWHDFTLDTRNPVNWVGLNDDRMVTFICPIEHYRAVEISWQNCQVQKLLSLEKSVCFRLSFGLTRIIDKLSSTSIHRIGSIWRRWEGVIYIYQTWVYHFPGCFYMKHPFTKCFFLHWPQDVLHVNEELKLMTGEMI